MSVSSIVGAAQSGKISWFGGPQDSSSGPTTSSGAPVSYPAISTYNQATKGGYWLVHMPNGRTAVLKQTDIGPAPWTGRNFDFTYTALPLLGYSTGNFPTDANITATYLGKSVPAQYQHLVIGQGGTAVSGMVSGARSNAQKQAGVTAPGQTTTTTTGGSTDFASAIADAMLQGEKPINPNGKFTAGSGILARALANVSSGAYTTPAQTTSTSAPSTGAVKAAAQAQMPTAKGTPGSGKGLIGSNLKYAGTDMGVDFSGSGPIPAVIQGVVTRVDPIGSGNGWPGGALVVIKGTGPDAGKFTYLAENFHPAVRVGQSVNRGMSLGSAVGVYPYIEYGWAANASGTTRTHAFHQNEFAARHSVGTTDGRDFQHYLGI